jgi:hypothetical protein
MLSRCEVHTTLLIGVCASGVENATLLQHSRQLAVAPNGAVMIVILW